MDEQASGQVAITFLGGFVPVQGEGTIGGAPFYFRARGAAWSLGIGTDPIGAPNWRHWEEWGTWPDAGYMAVPVAEALLRRAASIYLAGEPPGPRPGDGTEPFELTEAAIGDLLGLPDGAARVLTEMGDIPYLVWRGERWGRRSDALACRENSMATFWLTRAGYPRPEGWKEYVAPSPTGSEQGKPR